MERRNSALSDALRRIPNFVDGILVWLYSTTSTIRQGTKAGRDAKVLKTKFTKVGRTPTKFLPSGPFPLATHRTVHLPVISPLLGPNRPVISTSTWNAPQTCPARMRTAASLSSAVSPALTPTTAATYSSTFRMS